MATSAVLNAQTNRLPPAPTLQPAPADVTFLRDAWYIVGWSDEFTTAPVARTILGENLVFFRDSKGELAALRNRCPHRFAPLTDGRVIDDAIQCPYHGLRFDTAGRCVLNPHPPHTVTDALRVRAYPIIERYAGAWVWMGEGTPDEALMPDLGVTARTDGHRYVKGTIPLAANYMLMVDNLLDLTHVPILHDGSVGNAQMMEHLTSNVERDGDSVTLTRVNRGISAAPFYQKLYPPYQSIAIDKTQRMHWMLAGNLLLEITHHQTDAPDLHRTTTFTAHLLTPETATTSHYFWMATRDFDLDSDAHDAAVLKAAIDVLTNEDGKIVEEQQRAMGTSDFLGLKPAFIPTDAASIGARRILTEKIRQQQARAA